jgi:hypothetical protein
VIAINACPNGDVQQSKADMNWVYREVLGFKPLSGAHTGANMSGILLETLIE